MSLILIRNCFVMEKRKEKHLSIKKEKDQILDQHYWDLRWKNNLIGWDLGCASPPITAYMREYSNRNAAILIAGCGNAYEAVYLLENKFTNITLIDIAPNAIEQLNEKFKGNPFVQIICADFFKHQGQYDLLIEQTFFCAIVPNRRQEYVEKVSSLLKPGGRLIGVLFDEILNRIGPPFGGDLQAYQSLFSAYFDIKRMQKCFNSIGPREGKEIFINLEKR